MLIKRPEGLWDRVKLAENSTQWERCIEYFDFLCQLLQYLRGMIESVHMRSIMNCFFFLCFLLPMHPEYDQDALSVDVHQMTHTELEWFKDVLTITYPPAFQCVLAGHLHLCRALFTCEGVDKNKYGRDLCLQLISKFLFPASRMIHESHEPLQGIVSINPM